MNKIGIFFGSSSGVTERAAFFIQKELGIKNADVHHVGYIDYKMLDNYKTIIFGVSTWGIKEMQDDMKMFTDKLPQDILSGKKIALFGCGSHEKYPSSFVDAMGILYEFLQNMNCTLMGQCPNNWYKIRKSRALVNNQFVGLPLSDDSSIEENEKIIKDWIRNYLK